MDDQLLSSIVWRSYAFNKAFEELQYEMEYYANCVYCGSILKEDGLHFHFFDEVAFHHVFISKAEMVRAVDWKYFKEWLDNIIFSLTGEYVR